MIDLEKKFKELLDKKSSKNEQIVVEFGPGEKKYSKGSIGLDIVEKDSVDIVCDLSKGLFFIPDNSIDIIYSFHFLEHIDNIEFFMKEIFRVLKKGGKKIGSVPHFANPYFYSDYTHKNYWGLYSLTYFSNTNYFYRTTPKYYNDINFKINKINLKFDSIFRISYYLSKLYNFIFNYNNFFKELHESTFCYIIPAYEIEFEIEK